MKYYLFVSLCLLSFTAVAQYKPEKAYVEPAVRCQTDPLVMEKMIGLQEANDFDADNSKVVCARAYAEQGNLKKVTFWINSIKGAGAKRWAVAEAAKALVAGKRYQDAAQLLLPYVDMDPKKFDTIYPYYYLRQTRVSCYGISMLYSYAAVLYQKGDYTNAMQYFKKADEAERYDGYYHAREDELNTLLLWQTGKKELAIKRMRILLDRGTDRPEGYLTEVKQAFATYYNNSGYYQRFLDSLLASARKQKMEGIAYRKDLGPMPDVLLKDDKGKDFSLKSLYGKTVFIYFWNLPETNFKDNPFAAVQRAKEYYAKDTSVVFISIHYSEFIPGAGEAAKRYLDSRHINIPLYIDPQNFEHHNEALAFQLGAAESGQWFVQNEKGIVTYWTRDLREELAFEYIKAIVDAEKMKKI